MAQMPRDMAQMPRDIAQMPRNMAHMPRDMAQMHRAGDMSPMPRDMSQMPRDMAQLHGARDMSPMPRDMAYMHRDMSQNQTNCMNQIPRNMAEMPRNDLNREMNHMKQQIYKIPRPFDGPRGIIQMPKNINQSPILVDQSHKHTDHSHKNVDQSPSHINKSPKQLEQSSKHIDQSSKNTEQSSKQVEQSPRNKEQLVRCMEQSPSSMEQSSSSLEQQTPRKLYNQMLHPGNETPQVSSYADESNIVPRHIGEMVRQMNQMSDHQNVDTTPPNMENLKREEVYPGAKEPNWISGQFGYQPSCWDSGPSTIIKREMDSPDLLLDGIRNSMNEVYSSLSNPTRSHKRSRSLPGAYHMPLANKDESSDLLPELVMDHTFFQVKSEPDETKDSGFDGGYPVPGANLQTNSGSTPRKRRKKSEMVGNEDRRPVSDCKVCGDKAIAHMHYGGICCYSCKAFFRRAVQSGKDKKYTCKGNHDCTVVLTNRRGCQKCRHEKCLEIGMVASWVLSDEQCEMRFGKSKLKRKGGYPTKPKIETPMTPMVVLAPPTLSAETTLTGADELSLEYMSCVYEASKEMISFSDENDDLWSKLFKEPSKEKHNYNSSEMNGLIQTVVKKNIFFLEANSYFKKLDFDDKKSILQKNMSMMGQLRGALRFDPRDKKFLWYFNQKEKLKASDHVGQQNKTIDEADLSKFYKSDKASKGVISSMERILACGLNQVAILILIHVVVFDGDGLDLNNGVFVEQVQINYFNLLYRYFLSQYEKNYARKMLSRTISLLADLRGTCEANNETEANIETENT